MGLVGGQRVSHPQPREKKARFCQDPLPPPTQTLVCESCFDSNEQFYNLCDENEVLIYFTIQNSKTQSRAHKLAYNFAFASNSQIASRYDLRGCRKAYPSKTVR